MPVLSCRSQFFPATRLYSFLSSLYASINYIILNLVPFHYLSLLRTLTLSTTDSLSQSPSSNCVHYKVYFILHFIMYTFYFLLFFTYVSMILVKSSPAPVFAFFFGSSSLSEHIITFFVRAFHQHLFICIHFLFFSLTHLLLVLPCHIVPFNSIRLSLDMKSARSSVDFFLSRTRMRFRILCF